MLDKQSSDTHLIYSILLGIYLCGGSLNAGLSHIFQTIVY